MRSPTWPVDFDTLEALASKRSLTSNRFAHPPKYLTFRVIDVLFLFMARTTEKQARAEAMLGELAELGLMVARELAVRLRGCEDADETVALAGAFQQATRAVRLTLALDAKLDRDAAREAAVAAQQVREQAQADALANAARAAEQRRQEDHLATAKAAADPVEARKARVRGLLNRLLWTESEGEQDDYEVLVEDLEARLGEAALGPDFLDLPIEALARRAIADMGLSGSFALSLGAPQPQSKPAPERESALADTG